jgi:hypothetical protein
MNIVRIGEFFGLMPVIMFIIVIGMVNNVELIQVGSHGFLVKFVITYQIMLIFVAHTMSVVFGLMPLARV